MKATIQRQLFTATIFDSGSLGMLTSVVHPARRAGVYAVEIHRHGGRVASSSFRVSDDAPDMQLDLDLASIHETQIRRGDCECPPEPTDVLPVVSSRGYVLFFVSRGDGGYSARVLPQHDDDGEVFDTTELGEGDFFALCLLEPTGYRMANRLGKARGTIQVEFSPERVRRLQANPTTIPVDSYLERFDPADIRATSTQGIVFAVRESARIVVERSEPAPDGERPKRRRFARQRPARRAASPRAEDSSGRSSGER